MAMKQRITVASLAALAIGVSSLAPAGSALAAPADADVPFVTITTDNETPTLYDSDEGGNASGDDPAIWVDPADSSNSIVIATAKEGGLRVYDLDSAELQNLAATDGPRADGAPGRYNNVDVAYGVPVNGVPTDLAVVSDRYNDQVRFFAIDPAGAAAETPLTEVTAPDLPYLFNEDRAGVDTEQTAYGIAVWQSTAGDTFAVVTQEGTTDLALVKVVAQGDKVGYEPVDTISMPSQFDLPNGQTWIPCEDPGVLPQLEGVSIDRRTGTLFAAQEDVGLWRIQLTADGFVADSEKLIDKTKDFGIQDAYDEQTEECAPIDPNDTGFGGSLLEADAEGVDIYYGDGDAGYVVVSSQGDDTFAVYDVTGDNAPVGSFAIKGVNGVDDINGVDGVAIASVPVGEYTRGLLVTQDEPDTGEGVDEEQDPSNFSYVQWGDLADALGLTLATPPQAVEPGEEPSVEPSEEPSSEPSAEPGQQKPGAPVPPSTRGLPKTGR